MSDFLCVPGDCLERMAELAPESVGLVLVDLPYGTTRNRWDSVIPFEKLWAAWQRLCRPGAPVVLFTQQPFTTVAAASNLKNLRTEWIWEKPQGTGFLNASVYPLKAHENILVFCDRAPVYNPQKRAGFKPGHAKSVRTSRGTNYDPDSMRPVREKPWINRDGTRLPVTTLKFNRETGLHPTQKPVALCEYLIKTYTQPGATVLDCCMGSGTTGVAAMNTGRRFIGIERNPEYFELAAQRIADSAPAEIAA